VVQAQTVVDGQLEQLRERQLEQCQRDHQNVELRGPDQEPPNGMRQALALGHATVDDAGHDP
jgi:DNA-binding TFAR19-related protein (PDSD5 family)